MFKAEAIEAAPMCVRVFKVMLNNAPTQGRPGSDLRTAVGDFIAEAYVLLQTDQSGPPLNEIFVLARETGMGFPGLDLVRQAAVAETPQTVGAFIIKCALIELTLATECEVIANTTFVSRDDVDAIRDTMNEAFSPMEEIAADEMAQDTYQHLISLHAALAFHLSQTARPLPRMLNYAFYDTYSSLVVGYKLYSDASRCDELVAENKVVHPAFMPRTGRALAN
jgi:prophage DNA circulation protein